MRRRDDGRRVQTRLGGCRHAAVQDDVMPSHQRRTGRAKPDDGIGNFVHFAAPSDRLSLDRPLLHRLCPPIIPASMSVMISPGYTALIRIPRQRPPARQGRSLKVHGFCWVVIPVFLIAVSAGSAAAKIWKERDPKQAFLLVSDSSISSLERR
jgi:hypothetical protein